MTKPATEQAETNETTELAEATEVTLDADAPIRRRMIRITGASAPDDVLPGDLAVLERRSLGRRTILRMADELVAKGAAGLVVSDALLGDLDREARSELESRLPILVLGDEAGTERLLGPAGDENVDPDHVLRAILRGEAVTGPLPPHLETGTPIRAIALVARPDEDSPLPMSKLEEIIGAEALLRDPRSHAVTIDDAVIALAGEYDYSGDEEGMAQALMHRAKSALLIGELTVGVGRAYAGISGLRRTYREAIWAARAAEALGQAGGVTTFRELGIYGMLEPFVLDPSTADTEDVEKLVEYDHQNHTALLPTLEAFFDAGASGDAAASLFVHRNTVTYRLRAVERVTGLDVRDPDARLLLEVQIRLARIRGLLPPRSQSELREKPSRTTG